MTVHRCVRETVPDFSIFTVRYPTLMMPAGKTDQGWEMETEE